MDSSVTPSTKTYRWIATRNFRARHYKVSLIFAYKFCVPIFLATFFFRNGDNRAKFAICGALSCLTESMSGRVEIMTTECERPPEGFQNSSECAHDDLPSSLVQIKEWKLNGEVWLTGFSRHPWGKHKTPSWASLSHLFHFTSTPGLSCKV